MRSQKEIEDKLQSLEDELDNFSDIHQRRTILHEIARLKWVLGTGPDEIMVPHPF